MSRSGITSDGSKIEDMSCYKKLPTIQNKPPKAEYEMKTPNTRTRVMSNPPRLLARSAGWVRGPSFGPAEGELQSMQNSTKR
jgi:hypothetical protein